MLPTSVLCTGTGYGILWYWKVSALRLRFFQFLMLCQLPIAD